jgi:hypothetical protein
MPPSELLRRLALIKADVSEKRSASIIRSLSILVTLMEALRSSETSILRRTTRHYSPVDGILQSSM